MENHSDTLHVNRAAPGHICARASAISSSVLLLFQSWLSLQRELMEQRTHAHIFSFYCHGQMRPLSRTTFCSKGNGKMHINIVRNIKFRASS